MTVSFVLANSKHGGMIVSRLDYNQTFNGNYYGVGAQIFETGAYEPGEIELLSRLLEWRQHYHGNGVVVLDCGANIGVHTVEFAKRMRGWGQVIAIEAQERIFYALAGNLALNNCFNARAVWGAIDRQDGFLDIPEPDYNVLSSFGSFELKQRLGNENIGQPINYNKKTSRVQTYALDSIGLARVDLIKLDIEGMELDALAGARELIKRCKPLLFVECFKVDRDQLKQFFDEMNYKTFVHSISLLGAHADDPTLAQIEVDEEERTHGSN